MRGGHVYTLDMHLPSEPDCEGQKEEQGGRAYICNEASADYEGIGNRHRASYERRALSSFHQRPPCQRTIMLQSCAHNAKVFVNMHCSPTNDPI